MKKLILLLITLFCISIISAQEVSQKILVEHFTNTRCGICASKNPPFFTLLENYDEVHLAYYPSSPYASCIFSQHNKPEADGRTSYYGIFGSTPRAVINGEVVSISSSLLQESRIDAEVSNMTPFTIEASQEYINANSVKVNITVNTVATTNITNLTLHVMLAEKLVHYNAPNGENEHPDVFRKALYGLNGKSFTVPANGSSISFETNYSFDPDWVKEDMEIIAFIQDELDKTVKQATITPKIGLYQNGSETAISSLEDISVSIFPNPVQNILFVKGNSLQNANYTIYNLIGKKLIQEKELKSELDISNLNKGVYILEIQKDNKKYYTKFSKK